MDIGTGLFFGLVILGIIYLFTQTKDRWNWKKIVFWFLGIVFACIGIIPASIWLKALLIPIEGVDKPKLITSYDGISLGDTFADVEFKKGKLKTYEEFTKKKRGNKSDDLYLIDKTFGFFIDIKGKVVTGIVKGCNSDEYYSIEINGISCNDSGEKIIERFGKDVIVKCEVNPDAKVSPTRFYDVSKYGVRYQLSENKVKAFRVYPPAYFSSDSKNWEACK